MEPLCLSNGLVRSDDEGIPERLLVIQEHDLRVVATFGAIPELLEEATAKGTETRGEQRE